MYVGALSADNLAEYSLLSHVQGGHFKPVVAAVLQNHAVQAVLLAKVDEFPALVEVHSRRHFYCHVLAVLEGALSYREVVIPVGADVYKVDVAASAHIHVAIFAAIDCSLRQTLVGEIFLAFFGTAFLVVAQSHGVSARNMGKAVYGVRSAHTQASKAHAHYRQLRCCKVDDVLLTLWALRHIGHDSVATPVPASVWRQRLCLHRHHACGDQ